MSLMPDYQWPSFKENLLSNIAESLQYKKDLVEEIELFFEKKYQAHALLFPSARSGISAIMQYLKFSRTDVIFSSKWASKCVFDVIGNYSNPSVIMNIEVSKVLLIHKWGKIYRSENFTFNPEQIIEDSVDSFVLNPEALFPNQGAFEVFSLPKLIGGKCGGIILTKDEHFKNFAKNLQGQNMELARWQSRLKRGKAGNVAQFVSWHDSELKNFSMIEEDLLALREQLSLWDSSQKVILERLERLKEKVASADFIHETTKRLGPVLPLDLTKYNLSKMPGAMSRNFSFEAEVSRMQFKPCWLMPLHFGIDEKTFDQFFASLEFLEK